MKNRKGFDLGAVDYITKPFDPQALAPLIRNVLSRVARGERETLRRENIAELQRLMREAEQTPPSPEREALKSGASTAEWKRAASSFGRRVLWVVGIVALIALMTAVSFGFDSAVSTDTGALIFGAILLGSMVAVGAVGIWMSFRHREERRAEKVASRRATSPGEKPKLSDWWPHEAGWIAYAAAIIFCGAVFEAWTNAGLWWDYLFGLGVVVLVVYLLHLRGLISWYEHKEVRASKAPHEGGT